jgi:hypothetical protein
MWCTCQSSLLLKVVHGCFNSALNAPLAPLAAAAMLLQDHEQALERERASAASRLREACERYESQMQAGRMRLIADTGG